MNDRLDFERLVSERFAREHDVRPPDRAVDQILAQVGRARPLPRWLALIKEPTMRYSSSLAVGSPTARVLALGAATLLLIALATAVGVGASRLLAAGADFVVDPNGDGTHTTIAAAVAEAEDGATIHVRPGTYDESVTVTRDITIRGDGAREDIVVELSTPLPDGATDGQEGLPFAFLLEGSDARLQGLTIRGEPSRVVISGGAPALSDLHLDGVGRVWQIDPGSGSVPAGVELQDGTAASFTTSSLDDTDIDIESGSSPTVAGNTLRLGAIWISGDGSSPVIEGNTIETEAKWGVAVARGAHATVADNTIRGADPGIDIRNAAANGEPFRVVDNTIEDATTGIAVATTGFADASGVQAVLVGNDIVDSATAGISVRGEMSEIRDNTVVGGADGVFIGAAQAELYGNEISGASDTGLTLTSATTATLRDNRVCDNVVNLDAADGATVDIDDSNTICEDAAAG